MNLRHPCSRRTVLKTAAIATASLAFGRTTCAAKQVAEQHELASFDDMMHSFMAEKEPPGASLAVARAQKLVYARGFGMADRQKGQTVEPRNLFRIASISKPITATAIMLLVEQNKLQLDAKVIDVLKLSSPTDKRWNNITITHLLHHTGGWDRGVSFDPM